MGLNLRKFRAIFIVLLAYLGILLSLYKIYLYTMSEVQISDLNLFWISLLNCSCQISDEMNENDNIYESNLCSSRAFQRGSSQKIISFCLFGNPKSSQGNHRKYFKGILENAQVLNDFYPAWTIRLYHDLEKSDPISCGLCELTKKFKNLDICDVRKISPKFETDIKSIYPMIWRYLPVLDPQVSINKGYQSVVYNSG